MNYTKEDAKLAEELSNLYTYVYTATGFKQAWKKLYYQALLFSKLFPNITTKVKIIEDRPDGSYLLSVESNNNIMNYELCPGQNIKFKVPKQ